MQEIGHRRHAKHINNFSELLSTNIRRSTLTIQSNIHQSSKLLIFKPTSIKFNNNKNEKCGTTITSKSIYK